MSTFTRPDPRDVYILRDLLDLLESFPSNDQQAHFQSSSD